MTDQAILARVFLANHQVWMRELSILGCMMDKIFRRPRPIAALHMTACGEVRVVTHRVGRCVWACVLDGATLRMCRRRRTLGEASDEALRAFASLDLGHRCSPGCRRLSCTEVAELLLR